MNKNPTKNSNEVIHESEEPKKKESKKPMVASIPEYDSHQAFLNKNFLKAYLKYDLE
jgi:hypothetical protein